MPVGYSQLAWATSYKATGSPPSPPVSPHLMSASDCSRRCATIAAASPAGSASCPPPGLAWPASCSSALGCCCHCCAWGSRAAGRGAELPLGVPPAGPLPSAGCWRGGEVRPAMADCARAAAARALATRESTSSMLLAPAANEGCSTGAAPSPTAPPCWCSCWGGRRCCCCCSGGASGCSRCDGRSWCVLLLPAGCRTACPAATSPCLGGSTLPPPPPPLLPGRAASCSKPLALRPVAASSACAARPGSCPAPSSASERRNMGDSCWRICACRGRVAAGEGSFGQGRAPLQAAERWKHA